MVQVRQVLLLVRLLLCAKPLLPLQNTHTLTIRLLAKLAKLTRRSKLLLKALKPKICAELTGCLAKLSPLKPVLSLHPRPLHPQLIEVLKLAETLTLRLKLRSLICLLRL